MTITNIFIDVTFAPGRTAEVRMQHNGGFYELHLDYKSHVEDYIIYMKNHIEELEALVQSPIKLIEHSKP